jgi:cysteinyl-tRNA synthetase
MDELKAGARTDLDTNKRNAGDFALWFTKSKFENQALVWDSPWGRGYPGWHIECSAMSIKYLGECFDIHAGGIDHIPVHHTNEIAQSEAATGKHPWVKYWVHNEFLVLNMGNALMGKMSKSLGGFLTLESLVERGYDPLDYRYFLLGGHYRSQLQFSYEALDGARNARKSLGDRLRALSTQAKTKPAEGGESKEKADSCLASFNKALEDDLSTPRALAALWGLLKDQAVGPRHALDAAYDMDAVLGLNMAKESADNKEETGDKAEIERLIDDRKEAKKGKNFSRADGRRRQLKDQGIVLEDSPQGTTWRKA